jgi:ABC-type dipeptide/oligopeptide/nickel transport system ATPase component
MPKVVLESEIRENELIGILGTNRTGKTTKAISLAKMWKENNDGPVMAFDPQNYFTDIYDFKINPTNKSFGQEILKLRNGLLILDDFRILHPKNQSEPWLMDLMQYRNAYNIDIIYIVHNPSLVLNILSYFTTKYYIYYTESTMGSWERKIPNYNLCQAASLYINKYVSIRGKGTYPNFPYVMVDNIKQKLTGVNINK